MPWWFSASCVQNGICEACVNIRSCWHGAAAGALCILLECSKRLVGNVRNERQLKAARAPHRPQVLLHNVVERAAVQDSVGSNIVPLVAVCFSVAARFHM